MKLELVAACVAFAPTLSSTAGTDTAQQGAPSNSLSRAQAVFSVSDADHDGKISTAEARAIPVDSEEFLKQDLNSDGSWSRDEFTLYYRARLLVGGQSVGPDLEAEVARIQALKRVRIVEEARKQGVESPRGRCEIEPVRVRFEKALGDLEKSAASKKATPEDFRRLRNLVILSGRSASESKDGSLPAGASAKVLQALDRIEKRAAAGQCVPEDFEALRTLVASASSAGSPPSPPDRTGPVQGPADARRRSIEPRGSTRIAPKSPPQPESTKPPAPTPAPKPVPPPGAEKGPGQRSKP